MAVFTPDVAMCRVRRFCRIQHDATPHRIARHRIQCERTLSINYVVISRHFCSCRFATDYFNGPGKVIAQVCVCLA